MIHADSLVRDTQVCIDGKWVMARPLPFLTFFSFLNRGKDAWEVFRGRADAVKFYKQ